MNEAKYFWVQIDYNLACIIEFQYVECSVISKFNIYNEWSLNENKGK